MNNITWGSGRISPLDFFCLFRTALSVSFRVQCGLSVSFRVRIRVRVRVSISIRFVACVVTSGECCRMIVAILSSLICETG